MQISKHWAWILLLISISVSVVLSSIIFVVTELVSIGEMESIREVKSKFEHSILQIDEEYLEGVSSSNLKLLNNSHVCVEVIDRQCNRCI